MAAKITYPNERFHGKPRLVRVNMKRFPNHPKPWILLLVRGPSCEGGRTFKTWQDAINYLINGGR